MSRGLDNRTQPHEAQPTIEVLLASIVYLMSRYATRADQEVAMAVLASDDVGRTPRLPAGDLEKGGPASISPVAAAHTTTTSFSALAL